jgi:hypothetical protein
MKRKPSLDSIHSGTVQEKRKYGPYSIQVGALQ